MVRFGSAQCSNSLSQRCDAASGEESVAKAAEEFSDALLTAINDDVSKVGPVFLQIG